MGAANIDESFWGLLQWGAVHGMPYARQLHFHLFPPIYTKIMDRFRQLAEFYKVYD